MEGKNKKGFKEMAITSTNGIWSTTRDLELPDLSFVSCTDHRGGIKGCGTEVGRELVGKATVKSVVSWSERHR